MSRSASGCEYPHERQPAGRDQAAAGEAYRLHAPCLPAAVSYDPADEAMADTHRRMISDPGRQPGPGEPWVGHVVAWWAGPWGLGGSPQGWRRVVPCVALLSCEGELVRLFGWDAVDTLSAIVCSTDPGALALGFDAHVRSAADPAGEHWWWVIDRLGADGEIESEAIRNGQTGEGAGPAG